MKIKVLAGDMIPCTVWYTVPGAVNDEPVASVYEAEPESVRKLLGKPVRGLGQGVCFVAELASGGKILARTDARTYRKLVADLGDAPVSREYVNARRTQNSRQGFLLLGILMAAWLLLARYLQSWIAFVLAVFLAMAGGLLFYAVSSRLGKRAGR